MVRIEYKIKSSDEDSEYIRNFKFFFILNYFFKEKNYIMIIILLAVFLKNFFFLQMFLDGSKKIIIRSLIISISLFRLPIF